MKKVSKSTNGNDDDDGSELSQKNFETGLSFLSEFIYANPKIRKNFDSFTDKYNQVLQDHEEAETKKKELIKMAEKCEAEGKYDKAAQFARDYVAIYPDEEIGHRLLYRVRSTISHDMDELIALNDRLKQVMTKELRRVENKLSSNENDAKVEKLESERRKLRVHIEVLASERQPFFQRKYEKIIPHKNQDELKAIGNALVQQEKYEDAIELYSAALDIDACSEASAAIFSNRSMCYFCLERFEEAFDDGALAAVLRPAWEKGWLRKASAAVQLQKWSDAHEAYEKYFELDPDAKNDKKLVVKKSFVEANYEREVEKQKREEAEDIEKLGKFRSELRQALESGDEDKPSGFLASNMDLFSQRRVAKMSRLVIEENRSYLEKQQQQQQQQKQKQHQVMQRKLLESALAHSFAWTESSLSGETWHDTADRHEGFRLLLDEITRLQIRMTNDILCSACCSCDPSMLRLLLETKQFNTHSDSSMRCIQALLLVAKRGSSRNLPHQLVEDKIECLRLLLNYKNSDGKCLDLNRNYFHCIGKHNDEVLMEETVLLAHSWHPEIARFLIKCGANVNGSWEYDRTNRANSFKDGAFFSVAEQGLKEYESKAPIDPDCLVHENVLDHALLLWNNPHIEQLVEVLIGAGATLVVDDRDKNNKYSPTLRKLVNPTNFYDESFCFLKDVSYFRDKDKFSSFLDSACELVFPLLLQLNASQGLKLRDSKNSFFFLACKDDLVPVRFFAQLLAADPSKLKEVSSDGNVPLPIMLLHILNHKALEENPEKGAEADPVFQRKLAKLRFVLDSGAGLSDIILCAGDSPMRVKIDYLKSGCFPFKDEYLRRLFKMLDRSEYFEKCRNECLKKMEMTKPE